MISALTAMVLIGFGGGFALFCVVVGHILHMRYLDRKFMKPIPKQSTQQLPAVKP